MVAGLLSNDVSADEGVNDGEFLITGMAGKTWHHHDHCTIRRWLLYECLEVEHVRGSRYCGRRLKTVSYLNFFEDRHDKAGRCLQILDSQAGVLAGFLSIRRALRVPFDTRECR